MMIQIHSILPHPLVSTSDHLLPAYPPLAHCTQRSSFPWIRGSQHWPVSESLGGPVKTPIARLHPPQVLIQQVGAQGFAFLTRSEVIRMPQVWGPHCENHCWACCSIDPSALHSCGLIHPFPSRRVGDGIWKTLWGRPPPSLTFIFIICKMGTILQGKADQGQLLSLTLFAFWKKVPSNSKSRGLGTLPNLSSCCWDGADIGPEKKGRKKYGKKTRIWNMCGILSFMLALGETSGRTNQAFVALCFSGRNCDFANQWLSSLAIEPQPFFGLNEKQVPKDHDLPYFLCYSRHLVFAAFLNLFLASSKLLSLKWTVYVVLIPLGPRSSGDDAGVQRAKEDLYRTTHRISHI